VRIVITGATSGIGRELALQYAADGVHLGVVGRRADLLEEVAQACRGRGARVEAYTQDVTDGAGMRRLAEEFLRAAGGVDLVIANAGVGVPDKVQSGDPEPMTRLLSINVIGLVNTLIPFVPAMIEQGAGHLVAIASIAGERALPGHAAYCASKGCARMLLDGWAYKLEPKGIHLTTINPGFVESELTAGNDFPMPFLMRTDEACRRIREAIARKRRSYTFPLPMRLFGWLLGRAPRFVVARVR